MNPSRTEKQVSERIADRMTVILGLNELLLSGAFGPPTERQKGALHEMLETTRELQTLLEPLLFP